MFKVKKSDDGYCCAFNTFDVSEGFATPATDDSAGDDEEEEEEDDYYDYYDYNDDNSEGATESDDGDTGSGGGGSEEPLNQDVYREEWCAFYITNLQYINY